MHNFSVEKLPKNLGYVSNFQKRPKLNTCPMGENSANLVTLMSMSSRRGRHRVNWWPVSQNNEVKSLRRFNIKKVLRHHGDRSWLIFAVWDIWVKCTRVTHIMLWPLINFKKLCITIDTKLDGLQFGCFLHKVIWSPCSAHLLRNFESKKLYTLAWFEPMIFCFCGRCDVTEPRHQCRVIADSPIT
jgi:hypothetical protein